MSGVLHDEGFQFPEEIYVKSSSNRDCSCAGCEGFHPISMLGMGLFTASIGVGCPGKLFYVRVSIGFGC